MTIKSTHCTNYSCTMWLVQTSGHKVTKSMYYRSHPAHCGLQCLFCTPVQCTDYTLVWVFIRQKCFPTSISTVVPPDQLHLSKHDHNVSRQVYHVTSHRNSHRNSPHRGELYDEFLECLPLLFAHPDTVRGITHCTNWLNSQNYLPIMHVIS